MKRKNTGNKIIELENIWKIYHVGEVEIPALRGLNLAVKRGEFLAILGKSGSGKSTCVNHIGCLDTPTKGDIYLDGEDIAKFSESHLAQIRGRKIGFIFQSFNLIPSMTALENVMLPMVFQNKPREERIKKATELVGMVDLGDRLSHKPTEMSGGEQQRVAIARALANDPEVILADEPTGNLDSKTGEQIIKLFKDLNKEGKTIIIVTHDPNLALKHADITYWIKDGKLEKITKKGKRN